jgi:hypothetical protein
VIPGESYRAAEFPARAIHFHLFEEGLMKARIILGSLLAIGLLGVGAHASRGVNVAGARQWTIVNFVNPVSVQGQLVMGPVLIVHDDEKMAKGEACTTFYRFDPSRGPREQLVSFHCTPVQRNVAAVTTFKTVDGINDSSCKRLVEYQIAGDGEAHQVPGK